MPASRSEQHRQWALGQLDLAADASEADALSAAASALQLHGFVPTESLSDAFCVVRSAGNELDDEPLSFALDEEQRLLDCVGRFGERMFGLSPVDRSAEWQALLAETSRSPRPHALVSALRRGLRVDTSVLPTDDVDLNELAVQLFVLFPLPAARRAAQRWEILGRLSQDGDRWAVTANRLRDDYPEIAAIDQPLIDQLADWTTISRRARKAMQRGTHRPRMERESRRPRKKGRATAKSAQHRAAADPSPPPVHAEPIVEPQVEPKVEPAPQVDSSLVPQETESTPTAATNSTGSRKKLLVVAVVVGGVMFSGMLVGQLKRWVFSSSDPVIDVDAQPSTAVTIQPPTTSLEPVPPPVESQAADQRQRRDLPRLAKPFSLEDGMTAPSIWDSEDAGDSAPKNSIRRMQNIVGRPTAGNPSAGKPAAVTDKTATPGGSSSDKSSGDDDSGQATAGESTQSAADAPAIPPADAPIER